MNFTSHSRMVMANQERGKLNKVLYSLLGAACVWREDLKEKLKTLGFTPLKSDTGIFLNKSTVGIIVSTHMWTMVWEYA